MSGSFLHACAAGCAALLVAFATPLRAAVSDGATIDARIERLLAATVHAGEPGCVAGAAYDGGSIRVGAAGHADLTDGTPLSPDSIFNTASVSKQFTAFAALLLAQRGALSIDDPVIRYVPELEPSARGVTIRHLIHHIGGLRDYVSLLELKGRRQTDAVTRAETIEILGRQRSANTPAGAVYEYSNTGYFLLSVIVERVSGKSLAMFSAENIFEPLGMSSTSIVDRYPARIDRLARGHAPSAGGFVIRESPWEQTGDGQVHSTVGDLLRWSANLASGQVGGPVVRRMLEPGMLASGERLDYAAGLVLDEIDGRPAIVHRGTIAGYRAYLLRLPREAFSVAVLCNRSDVQTQIHAASIAGLFVPSSPRERQQQHPLTTENDARLLDVWQVASGWYRDPDTATYLQVSREAQAPRLRLGVSELSIRPVEGRRYRIAELGDARLMFTRMTDGTGTAIHIEAVPFHGRFVPAPQWPVTSLNSYVATYRSDEVEAAIAFELVKGVASATVAGHRVILRPAAPGELRADDGAFVLRFVPTDAPRELHYYTHGVRGLRFERQR